MSRKIKTGSMWAPFAWALVLGHNHGRPKKYELEHKAFAILNLVNIVINASLKLFLTCQVILSLLYIYIRNISIFFICFSILSHGLETEMPSQIRARIFARWR
jgi:hypothetical protein